MAAIPQRNSPTSAADSKLPNDFRRVALPHFTRHTVASDRDADTLRAATFNVHQAERDRSGVVTGRLGGKGGEESRVAYSLEWARQLKEQLQDEIRTLGARAREGSRSAETPGFLTEQDRLQDLSQRLAQVDRLIEAMLETDADPETAWPVHLGDPGAEERIDGRPKVPSH
jgi:hypothetical protein